MKRLHADLAALREATWRDSSLLRTTPRETGGHRRAVGKERRAKRGETEGLKTEEARATAGEAYDGRSTEAEERRGGRGGGHRGKGGRRGDTRDPSGKKGKKKGRRWRLYIKR